MALWLLGGYVSSPIRNPQEKGHWKDPVAWSYKKVGLWYAHVCGRDHPASHSNLGTPLCCPTHTACSIAPFYTLSYPPAPSMLLIQTPPVCPTCPQLAHTSLSTLLSDQLREITRTKVRPQQGSIHFLSPAHSHDDNEPLPLLRVHRASLCFIFLVKPSPQPGDMNPAVLLPISEWTKAVLSLWTFTSEPLRLGCSPICSCPACLRWALRP